MAYCFETHFSLGLRFGLWPENGTVLHSQVAHVALELLTRLKPAVLVVQPPAREAGVPAWLRLGVPTHPPYWPCLWLPLRWDQRAWLEPYSCRCQFHDLDTVK